MKQKEKQNKKKRKRITTEICRKKLEKAELDKNKQTVAMGNDVNTILAEQNDTKK